MYVYFDLGVSECSLLFGDGWVPLVGLVGVCCFAGLLVCAFILRVVG